MAPPLSDEARQFIDTCDLILCDLTICQIEAAYISFSLHDLQTVPPFDLMRKVVVEVYLDEIDIDDDNYVDKTYVPRRCQAVARYLSSTR